MTTVGPIPISPSFTSPSISLPPPPPTIGTSRMTTSSPAPPSHSSSSNNQYISPQPTISIDPTRSISPSTYNPTSQHSLQQAPSSSSNNTYNLSTPQTSQYYHQQQQQYQSHSHPSSASQSSAHHASHYQSPHPHSGPISGDWKNSQQSQAGPSSHRRQSSREDQHRIPLEHDDGRVGTEDPFGERTYTEVKCLGDGSFGTVWLCDWHSPVKSHTFLSAMQCGAGARPEWAGKRLVALKRMKRVWEGGWSQAKNLGELKSLRLIPPHDAIIPLYDAFISPKSRELYFVFECMEGNLYQLTKSRRGRPLAAGLIASCFHQISTGLHHIHRHGYFHRDMKPENLLVTTTGLTDYLTAATLSSINTARGSSSGSDEPLPRTPTSGNMEMKYEKDVSVIVKLADFGLARATSSKPPYTEYVSTRWYRAPEVLLRSREYGAPVDMWALGTILAEMLNLKPIFPGVSEIDQVYRICDCLGDPSLEYGLDERGRTVGGGSWNTGIKLAKNVGFSFPKRQPVDFKALFNSAVPQSLIDCIADLLRYNPRYRLTSAQCIEHPYFHETLPHLRQTPPLPKIPFSAGQPAPNQQRQIQAELNAPPRQLPPSHSYHSIQAPEARPAFANGDMRNLPPPVGTPEHLLQQQLLHQQQQQHQQQRQGGLPSSASAGRLFFGPNQGSDSQSSLHGDGRAYGASQLVSALRDLDLPTEDLSSYGNRPNPVPGSTNDQAHSQYTDPRGQNGSGYDGSNPDLAYQSAPLSISNLHLADRSDRRPSGHVAAFVQQQQAQMGMYDSSSPGSSGNLPMAPPPIEPTVGGKQIPGLQPPSTVSKQKKKWGLSSVFGSSEKSLPIVEENPSAYAGSSSSSLKRTQSGRHPEIIPPLPPPIDPATITDPKKAKKEAERQAKELEKAKREAAVRAQQERARAVMRKRQQVVDEKISRHQDPAIEERTGMTHEEIKPQPFKITPGSNIVSAANLASRVDLRQSTSSNNLADGGSQAHLVRMPPSHGSQQNLRLDSASHLSQQQQQQMSQQQQQQQHMHQTLPNEFGQNPHAVQQGQLSASALEARDRMQMEKDPAYFARHKARRRNDDDDHSMSSFGPNSMKSRSALTVGTIDSDPGPRRDPLVEAQQRRHASYKSSHRPSSKSRLMSGSNPSLESQLAHEFRVHTNLTSSSATSLGRHGQSSMSLHDVPVPPLPTHTFDPSLQYGHSGLPSHHHHHQQQGSAPTSPYGHPKANAVSMGQGLGRDYIHTQSQEQLLLQQHQQQHMQTQGMGYGGNQLPPISDLEGGQGMINPMFRVPPAHPSTTTLPPFSSLASVADQQHRSSPHQNQ